MKVLLVNGGPHKEGCTYTALTAVADSLAAEGIGTQMFWIGTKPLSGCIACKTCVQKKTCVFDDKVNEFLDIAGDFDGFVFGSPVHWGGATGAITSFLDRASMPTSAAAGTVSFSSPPPLSSPPGGRAPPPLGIS